MHREIIITEDGSPIISFSKEYDPPGMAFPGKDLCIILLLPNRKALKGVR